MRGAPPPRRRETFDGPNEHELGPDDSFPGTPEAFPVLTRLFNRDGRIFEFENDESEIGIRSDEEHRSQQPLPIHSFDNVSLPPLRGVIGYKIRDHGGP